ncbi:hypothetical protein GCM10009584_23960 [Ornithinimicrobium humiphilum]|uniref:Uncharacterized protein DUF885 n=1 Tax=Ornithinimicrobium humiphilum TaxID=125288 RepID=A0A543KML3_9MICO|nr:DUF885 family protein [Ornithinimicrobium humiphilum]TQM96313.1 uncharacterized protein DUF885 [Ornithinimicrobium humiphilum]
MHRFAQSLVQADPDLAREVGALDPMSGSLPLRLPSTDPDHYLRLESTVASWARPVRAPEGTREWLEERCVQAEVVHQLHVLRTARPWQRAPYWYAEALGGALTTVDPTRLGGHDYASLYVDLLQEGWAFLDAGHKLLKPADVPRRWAAMAVPAVQGVRTLVLRELGAFSQLLPGHLVEEAEARRVSLAAAIEGFASHCRTLAETGKGRWAVGERAFSLLLRDYHCLDLTAEQVWQHGWESVEQAEHDLEELAGRLDPARTWQEQIEALKAERTPAEEFVPAYRAEVDECLRLTLEHDLVTVPPEQECIVAPLPDFRRAGLPLGEMRIVPPYAARLTSQFLITTADERATPEQVEGHERDNCPTFIRSIVGHETYPGHHLQSVHHVLGTERDSFLRFFRTPLFVEGWGLYVEDVLEEQVWGESTQSLFARRNRLWRSLRLVIDTGLHTGRLSHEQAVELLMERTGMDRHMAEGEVDRYTRHDNPTYPSTYVLGRDLFHELRTRFANRIPDGGLGRLHDALLRHGSPPVALLGPVLDKELP